MLGVWLHVFKSGILNIFNLFKGEIFEEIFLNLFVCFRIESPNEGFQTLNFKDLHLPFSSVQFVHNVFFWSYRRQTTSSWSLINLLPAYSVHVQHFHAVISAVYPALLWMLMCEVESGSKCHSKTEKRGLELRRCFHCLVFDLQSFWPWSKTHRGSDYHITQCSLHCTLSASVR